MSEILFHYYRINPTTWVYIASIIMIAAYFKFSRFWSVRNLDLALLILLAPGLLIAQYGGEVRVKALRLVEMEALEASQAAGEQEGGGGESSFGESPSNKLLEDSPELVNSDPYNDGWMIEVQPENSQELDELLEKKAYLDMLKGME